MKPQPIKNEHTHKQTKNNMSRIAWNTTRQYHLLREVLQKFISIYLCQDLRYIPVYEFICIGSWENLKREWFSIAASYVRLWYRNTNKINSCQAITKYMFYEICSLVPEKKPIKLCTGRWADRLKFYKIVILQTERATFSKNTRNFSEHWKTFKFVRKKNKLRSLEIPVFFLCL